jgi:RND family efflux transporter MFP subunit
MKKVCLLIIVILALAVSACTPTAMPTPIPTLVLDNNGTSNNNQSSDANSISASAIVVPVKEAQLSLPAVGKVTAVDVKVGDRVTAGQTLVTLDTAILEARVREAEANLLAAEVQLKYNRRLGLDEVHIETSEADVARAQALLESAKAVLASQSTLIAPFNGTIVSLDVATGETVVPGQIVIVLGDLSWYQIETTVLSERNVTRIQTGQPASIFIEALNEEFSGEVIDIDRIGSTLGGDVVYTVTVGFDNQPKGLLWGMSADVEIAAVDD